MRPIILAMTAFGPYAGKETVDFREAVASGLFGIYGSTGSGKSTIFSAITFALFGEASRSDQDTSSLRSHHAADDLLTRVDFIFEVGATRYLIRRTPDQMRPALRGDGETKDAHKAWLFDVTGIDPEDITEENCGKVLAEKKVSDVKVAVLERLGYGAEQFRQIVLLPQGKFETFLTAKTDERMKILRDLFDVSLYRKLAQSLKDQAKATEDAVVIERRTCAGRLNQEDFESPDALKTGLADAKTEEAKAKTIAEQAIKAANLAGKAKTEAEKLDAAFIAQTQAHSGLQALLDRSAEMDRVNVTLENARKAQSLLDVDQGQQAAQTALVKEETAKTDAQKADESAALRLEAASQKFEAQKVLDTKRDGQRREVETLERHSQTLSKASSLLTGWESAQAKKVVATQHYQQAEARFNQSGTEQENANHQLKVAQASAVQRGKVNAELSERKQALSAATSYATATRLLTEAADLVTQARAERSDKKNHLDASQSRFDQAEQALAAAQAQHLAEKLVDGESCAVCGSKSHPAPAAGRAESAGRNQAFEDAKANLTSARAAHGASDSAFSAAQARLDDRKVHLDGLAAPKQTLDTTQQRVNALNAQLAELGPEADTSEIETRLARLEEDILVAQEAVSKARTVLEAVKTTSALAKQAYETALGSIPEALRNELALTLASKSAADTLKTMQAALQQAQDADKSAREAKLSCAKDFENAKTRLTEAEVAQKTAAEAFAARLKKHGFSAEAFESHKLHIDHIEALTTQMGTYKEAVAIAKDRAKATAEAVKDKTRPDTAVLAQVFNAAEIARNDEAAKAATAKARADSLAALLTSISDELARIEKVEQDSAALRELAALFNAQNDAKLDLETFAIGAMFDQVLQAANLRLQPMTSRRYSLEREFDGKGGGRRGLGISVHDIHTGKARATSTLSGGETFIAALSLALGLSDIVESVSGNIRLDTIFIDEGFASLDTDNDSGTLDQVLQTLQDLVGDNRAVGLISHVQLVQHAIPNGFTIKKTATGSHVEMRGF